MARQQKLYYHIALNASSPGGCCKLRYWSRLQAHEVQANERSAITNCRTRPMKATPPHYYGMSARHRAKVIIQSFVFPGIHAPLAQQLKVTQAMPKTLIFNLLLAQAMVQQGVLFMIDNVSGSGDFERGDITIRAFCTWLSNRKQKFGTLRKVPNLTYRKHLTAWLYSPNSLSEPYPRTRPASPEYKFFEKVAKDLEKWAQRRANGEA